MSPEYFQKFAAQCRELLRRARTDAVREQLRLWVDEFEAQAALLDRDVCAARANLHDPC